jgi:hypothetical protein
MEIAVSAAGRERPDNSNPGPTLAAAAAATRGAACLRLARALRPWAVVVALFASAAHAQSPTPPDRPPIPPPGHGFEPRLRIVNQCTRDVWAIFTPGGAPNQIAALDNSGKWFRSYVTQEQFTGTGALADASVTPTKTVTVYQPPVDPAVYFVPGQFVMFVITKEIADDDFSRVTAAEIVGVTPRPVEKGTLLKLDRAVAVPSDPSDKEHDFKAKIYVDELIGGVAIPAHGSKTFEVPDGGAPSGRFSFFTGCPKNNNDPFNQHSCAVGAANTDLSGINTVAEVSFGCAYKTNGKTQCAFNPGDTTPNYPDCQENPNAKNCGPLGTNDYYDVSAVDGYTFPVRVDVTAQSKTLLCNNNAGDNPVTAENASVDGSMLDLASCPSEDKTTLYSTNARQQKLIDRGINLLTKWNTDDKPAAGGAPKACVAPYKWFQLETLGNPVDTSPQPPNCANGACTSTSYYAAESCDGTNATTLKYFCPQHSGPQQRVGPHLVVESGGYRIPDGRFSVHNSNFVKDLYALGYKGYTWQFDDGVGLLNCPSTAESDQPEKYTRYTITVCPSGGTRDPTTGEHWQYSSATGTCLPSSGSGAAGAIYASIAGCQQANMRYVCDDVTEYDPYDVPNALWRADQHATLDKRGFTWAEVEKIKIRTAATCGNRTYPHGITPDFAGSVSLPLCTYYYGGGTKLCPAPPR